MEEVTEPTPHVDGPPWTIAARFAEFEEADRKRKELAQEEDLQVKVHYMTPLRKDPFFAVKTRIDPTSQLTTTKNKKNKKRKS